MNEPAATFAVVGAVNHGKSSVVATLAENDEVRISSMPGETVDCQRFALADLFVFFDTPGFQNAHETLAELEPAEHATQPLDVFRQFVARHGNDPAFDAECRLFCPVIEGAGVLYVVDGSEPVLPIHAAEMRILRLTGAPRLAVINRTRSEDHIADWKRRLGLHFNAVREFDAHHATFADRIELLETLAGIEQSWKPRLTRAIAMLREDWERRLAECAEVIAELLHDALTHREFLPADHLSRADAAAAGEQLRERYLAAVAARETRAHKALIRIFSHKLVRSESDADGLVGDELFSEETWRAFGLTQRQLIAAGAAAGAAAGGALDLVTAGHTLLMGAAAGSAVGAAGALLFGKTRPELKVSLPWEIPFFGKKLQLTGREIAVGPCGALNFPWVLLDRALGTFAYVSTRAHARREATTLRSAELKTALDAAGLATDGWPEDARRTLIELFAKIRQGKFTADHRRALRDTLTSRLQAAASAKLPAAAVRS